MYVQVVDRNTARSILPDMKENSLLLTEQNGCYSGIKGYKDQILISETIFEDCRKRIKDLNVAWIGYQKKFDNVPHSRIEKLIELIEVNYEDFRFCNLSTEKWSTQLQLKEINDYCNLQ
jgi:hypothetical protein